MTAPRPVLLAALAMAAASLLAQATAQGLLGGDKDDAQPIEIEARDGIEWLRDAKQYIARGDAVAKRGSFEVYADTLTAHYRDDSGDNGQKIFRLDADGNVVVQSNGDMAFGDKAVYHVDDKIAVLVGQALRFETEEAIITAKESLEFWELKELAVARGSAVVVSQDRRLKADILTAYILPDSKGRKSVQRIDAIGNVHVSTDNEIVRGQEGVYDVAQSLATVCGNVRITRGENQLNGECAEVNMETGRSRLLSGDKDQRLKALIIQTE